MQGTKSLRSDDRGNIVVIGVFMATALVGCLWYTFGLGEAMIYRQQLRAASDATAFASATLHAVGMNLVSFTNIVMAVVLSVLVILQLLFVISLIITILLLVSDILSGGAVTELAVAALEADEWLFQAIDKTQKPVWMVVAGLNIAEGVEGVVMPWVAWFAAKEVPGQYNLASAPLIQPLSLSLIPMNVPGIGNIYFANREEDKNAPPGKHEWNGPQHAPGGGGKHESNGQGKHEWNGPQHQWSPQHEAADMCDESKDNGSSKLVSALQDRAPLVKSFRKLWCESGAFSVPGASHVVMKYGLPIIDDTYPVLCQHAAQEVVQEAGLFSLVLGTGAMQSLFDSPAFNEVGYWFGQLIGTFPGIFCSGVDPEFAIENQSGVSLAFLDFLLDWMAGKSADKKNDVATHTKNQPKHLVARFKRIIEDLKESIEKEKGKEPWYHKTGFPMMTFLPYENGNVFGQTWATIAGNNTPTLGAIRGVAAAGSSGAQASAKTEEADDEKTDFSEAEFYYECGQHATHPPSMGRSGLPFLDNDSSGQWADCKPNAMWNMFWRARLVRWHEAELDVAQIGAFVAFAGALEPMIDTLSERVPLLNTGGGVFRRLVDSIENCAEVIGKGEKPSPLPGHCPIPMLKFGGSIGIGGGGEEVYH